MSDIINPHFQTSPYMLHKPFSTDKLKQIIEKNEPFFRGAFRRKGFVTSKEYSFITYANFDENKNCGLDEKYQPIIKKSEIEKKIAEENLNYVQQHLQAEIPNRNIKVQFYARESDECALVDVNRFNPQKIQEILKTYFE